MHRTGRRTLEGLGAQDILNYRWRGVLFALLQMCAWALSLTFALFGPVDPVETPLLALPLFLLQIHLFTGLFITAHDAMHGLIAPGRRRLNDLLGALALFLYAFFPYEPFYTAHHRHHAAPASPTDPDYCDPARPGLIPWFGRFMGHYAQLSQIVAMGSALTVLTQGFGVSLPRAFGFWIVPALLGALSLFYFGTYLPHRPDGSGGPKGPHHARSNDFPPWLSYLTCYHFGYHLEHHTIPFAPWWRLPRVRRVMRAARDATETPRAS